MVTPDYPPKDDVFQLASSLNYPLDFPQILARLKSFGFKPAQASVALSVVRSRALTLAHFCQFVTSGNRFLGIIV
jgi:hypothetical protein